MRPQPKVAKRCRLSEGYRRKDAWARIGFGASDLLGHERTDFAAMHGMEF
jgi:hypothetical protein